MSLFFLRAYTLQYVFSNVKHLTFKSQDSFFMQLIFNEEFTEEHSGLNLYLNIY